jgi:hypothetical protein
MQFDGSLGSSFPIKVWQVWAPLQYKFFVWLLLQNRIWTADRLMSREWPKQYFCPLCNRNLETTDHLLIECPWSRRIWMDISRWTSSSCLQPHCWRASWGVMEWFSRLTVSSGSAKAKGRRSLVILVCWAIWRERNSRIFEAEEKSLPRLLAAIRDEAMLWVQARAKHLSLLVGSQCSEYFSFLKSLD